MDLPQSISNQTQFSLAIAKRVALEDAKDSNLVVSPPTIHLVLSLIAAGSTGQSLDQFLSLLNSKSINELNSLSSQVVADVFADGSLVGVPRLSFANRVWIDHSVSLKPFFKHVVEDVYKAVSNHVDFQTKESSPLSLFKFFYGMINSFQLYTSKFNFCSIFLTKFATWHATSTASAQTQYPASAQTQYPSSQTKPSTHQSKSISQQPIPTNPFHLYLLPIIFPQIHHYHHHPHQTHPLYLKPPIHYHHEPPSP